MTAVAEHPVTVREPATLIDRFLPSPLLSGPLITVTDPVNNTAPTSPISTQTDQTPAKAVRRQAKHRATKKSAFARVWGMIATVISFLLLLLRAMCTPFVMVAAACEATDRTKTLETCYRLLIVATISIAAALTTIVSWYGMSAHVEQHLRKDENYTHYDLMGASPLLLVFTLLMLTVLATILAIVASIFSDTVAHMWHRSSFEKETQSSDRINALANRLYDYWPVPSGILCFAAIVQALVVMLLFV